MMNLKNLCLAIHTYALGEVDYGQINEVVTRSPWI